MNSSDLSESYIKLKVKSSNVKTYSNYSTRDDSLTYLKDTSDAKTYINSKSLTNYNSDSDMQLMRKIRETTTIKSGNTNCYGINEASLNFIKSVRPEPIVSSKQILSKKNSKFLLVIDLDETLIARIKNPNDYLPTDIDILYYVQGIAYSTKIRPRPYLLNFINSIPNEYELVLFTASIYEYASKCIEVLNIKWRFNKILDRSYCISRYVTHNNRQLEILIKDLRVFANVRISDILIVDNYIYSYCLHLANGIPIKTWNGDVNNQCLLNLLKYLKSLSSICSINSQGNYIAYWNKFWWDIYNVLGVNDPMYIEKEMNADNLEAIKSINSKMTNLKWECNMIE